MVIAAGALAGCDEGEADEVVVLSSNSRTASTCSGCRP